MKTLVRCTISGKKNYNRQSVININSSIINNSHIFQDFLGSFKNNVYFCSVNNLKDLFDNEYINI